MPFQPGQSGNPGGRPRALKEVEDAARAHTADAISALASIVRGEGEKYDARAIATAAGILLDRGWGKAKQVVELEGELTQRVICEAPLSEEEWQARFGQPKSK